MKQKSLQGEVWLRYVKAIDEQDSARLHDIWITLLICYLQCYILFTFITRILLASRTGHAQYRRYRAI